MSPEPKRVRVDLWIPDQEWIDALRTISEKGVDVTDPEALNRNVKILTGAVVMLNDALITYCDVLEGIATGKLAVRAFNPDDKGTRERGERDAK